LAFRHQPQPAKQRPNRIGEQAHHEYRAEQGSDHRIKLQAAEICVRDGDEKQRRVEEPVAELLESAPRSRVDHRRPAQQVAGQDQKKDRHYAFEYGEHVFVAARIGLRAIGTPARRV
jgi:hypothetical protein